ncbi:DMT family transporter [Clostridium estertheticum]|uniref:DMT family transporter n=1 Tax=Clostridium estertheticum TaxID=238834 RepID=UPI001C0BF1E1|nr:DMT family transporter [Clostridium estertheticum]MBU3183770.1 DMT family transporter [Clostridium estertheticum]
MNVRHKGIIFTVVSAIIFGFTPAIGKITYSMGSNGIQLAFFKSTFALPIFLIIVLYNKLSLKLSKQQLFDVLIIGLIGSTLTTVLLYSSYSFIDVGSATVLHFLYPLFVCLINFVFYHQKLNKQQIFSLFVAMIGIACFAENKSISIIGFALATISGVFYAYYMVGMDHSSVRELNLFVFNFYISIINFLGVLVLGLFTHSFSIMSMKGYLLSLLIAIFVALIGGVLIQKGIYYLGASLTAILSTLEPITSIIVGIIFLNEGLTIQKIIGCSLVLVSTVILTKSQNKENEQKITI